MKALLSSLLFLSLAACATSPDSPYARGHEPHAIVDLDIPKPPRKQFRAFFQTVDGKQVAGQPEQVLLKPGKHSLRFGAVFDDYANLLPAIGPEKKVPALEIEVKAGVRYTVAALLEGRRGDEWKPVVTEERAIR